MEQKNKLLTLPIGSRFEYDGKTYEVKELPLVSRKTTCELCAFRNPKKFRCIGSSEFYAVSGECSEYTRDDGVMAYFVEARP